MTSSATTTEAGKAGSFELPTLPIAVLGGINIAGWVLVLYVNHWRFTAPVVFLMLAWSSLMLIANYLWNAGVAAASPTDDHDGFNVVETRHEELLREKRSLLKALKEIEFDQQLGKMSDEDAAEIASVYRARAIEVIKLLEAVDDGTAGADQDIGVRELIEREVKARRSLGASARKAARQLAGKKARKKAKGGAAAKSKKAPRASAKPAPHAGGKAVFEPDTEDLVSNSESAREEEE